jgi:hypothetical protein
MDKQQHQQSIRLDVLLEKCTKLNRFLRVSKKLSSETRENIRWYCDWRIHKYYKQYEIFLANKINVDIQQE